MIYLSSTTSIPEQYQHNFGIMFSAKYSIGGQKEALESNLPWMMDNNAFSGGFKTETWLKELLKHQKYSDTCLGIPIIDKVGDALATLRLFSQYWRVVHDLGFPVAFVSQDGITPEITPWNHFEVLFVGGTDEHKLHNEAGIMIAEAIDRGKKVHIGRVNSASRIKQFWMADSVDGTHLTKETGTGREKAVAAFSAAIDYCNNKKRGLIDAKGQGKLF